MSNRDESTTQKVLLVDDDASIGVLFTHLIKRNKINLDVTWVKNGKEALGNLEEESCYDAILLDINMPILNGWGFLKQYKNLDYRIPIIILTSSIDPKDHDRANEFQHVNKFFQKPITKQQLILIYNQCKLFNVSS